MTTPRPETHPLDCPKCGCSLFRVSEGELTLRAKVLVLGPNGQVVAKCPKKCDGQVTVPFLTIQDSDPTRRFVVRRPNTAPRSG